MSHHFAGREQAVSELVVFVCRFAVLSIFVLLCRCKNLPAVKLYHTCPAPKTHTHPHTQTHFWSNAVKLSVLEDDVHLLFGPCRISASKNKKEKLFCQKRSHDGKRLHRQTLFDAQFMTCIDISKLLFPFVHQDVARIEKRKKMN